MKTTLVELISKISAGVMSDDEVARIADEAAQAYADPLAFLAANPDINYDDSFPIPLGEWVVVGSLPDTVLFQADTYGDLFAQIVASFGPGVAFNLKPKQLAKTEDLTALNRIQIQMGSMSPEQGGYVLVNLSQLGGIREIENEEVRHGRGHRVDLVLLAGAVELGNDGGEGHDDALHQQDDRQPEAGRHRHGGKIHGAHLSRHHGIDEVHGDLGHLGYQYGAG